MSPEFIAEMAWKSAAIAGLALLVLTLLRSRSAADRAAVGRLAIVLLLLLPVVSLGLPALQIERPKAPVVEILPADALPMPIEVESAAPIPVLVASASAPAPVERSFEISTQALLPAIYAIGVLLLLGRLLAGLGTLRRWTAAAEPVTVPAWTHAMRRARSRTGVDRPVRLLASDDVPSPMSWGLARPAILVDFDTLARPDDADAVLAHELAHVARRDWAMLMLSRVAVVLFWFNPLVWRLERALIEQAEEAADLRAVGGVEPVSYARTLVACGAQAGGHLVPANSIAAGGGLAKRVRAVLDEKRRLTPSGSAWTAAAMLGCVMAAAPIAALELVAPEPPAAPSGPASPLAPTDPKAPTEPVATELPDSPAAPSPMAPEDAELGSLEAEVEMAVAAEVPQVRVAAVEAAAEAAAVRAVQAVAVAAPAIARAEVAAAAATAAVAAIDVDDLIEMKVHGIDAAYLSQLAAIAPRVRLSVDEIVEAKIHGLTPTKLREFAEVGYGRIDIDDLVAMQIHGVSPTFIREMAAAGYRGLSADDLVALRIHGVSPDRARRAAAKGRRPSAEELVEMSIHGKL